MIRNFGAVTGITNQPQGLDIGLGGSSIKSIQSGVTVLTGGSSSVTANVSSVDLKKAILILSFKGASDTAQNVFTKGVLTNATTLTFSRVSTAANSVTISWTVVEFNNVKSLQSGVASYASVASLGVTIASVDTAKSLLYFSYNSTNNASAPPLSSELLRGTITGATQITFDTQISNSPDTFSISWQVIEFN